MVAHMNLDEAHSPPGQTIFSLHSPDNALEFEVELKILLLLSI